jgi:hypothetical protein
VPPKTNKNQIIGTCLFCPRVSLFEKSTWDAPRIYGKLLMLGFDVSERTVSRWMKRAPRDPEPARHWLMFLRNHREAIAAMDFITVPTITIMASSPRVSERLRFTSSCSP